MLKKLLKMNSKNKSAQDILLKLVDETTQNLLVRNQELLKKAVSK